MENVMLDQNKRNIKLIGELSQPIIELMSENFD